MSKAVLGAVELVGAVGMGVAAFMDPALLGTVWFDKVLAGLVMGGIGNLAGAIGDAITGNRSMQVATRQPASPRTIVYGTQMVGGTLVFESFTGHQWNQVIVLAGHEIEAIDAVFLDGRKVVFQNGTFGGDASGSDQIGPDGVTKYNFGGKVSAFYRLGDQQFGDYMQELHGNDPTWGPNANGDVPSLTGCAYVYLKLTSSSSQFPSRPEVKFLIRGKNNILDPRTNQRGFTNNAALVLSDVIADTSFGLGDSNINTAQLIAAANACDEQVAVAALNGQTESRYCCDWAYDTSTGVSDVMQTMLIGMAGRWSFIGGEHFIFPGVYTGPSASLNISDITAGFDWSPNRSIRDLPNRVSATHVSPEWPFSTAGNFYQNRQTVENTFDLRFTQSSVPDYAQDQLHGYPSDEWLTQDNGHQRPMNINLSTVLSVTQCQRVMKINLMRQRKHQGSGTIELKLWNYKYQPCDTTQFTFAQLGWSNRIMEVLGTSLSVDTGGDGNVPTVKYALQLQETGSDVYDWSTIEELTVYSSPASPTQTPWTPNPPTNMQLTSGPQTAIVSQDGIATPVIQVTWDTPLDNAAVGILIQYQQVGASTWSAAPTADISVNEGLISTVVAGLSYNVRIATVRANGATSDFVEQDNFLVPLLDSFLGQLSSQIAGGGWLGKWWRLQSGVTPPAGGGELAQPTLFMTQGQIVNFMILTANGSQYSFNRGIKVPPPPDGGDLEWVYARFTCMFTAQSTGVYTFGLNSDDGSKMTVNNQVIFDRLTVGNSGATDLTYSFSGTISLESGKQYSIVVEMYNGGGSGAIQALYTPPGASSPQLIDLSTTYRDASSIQYGNGTSVDSTLPNVYAGSGGNIVPNGNFQLGLQGWTTASGLVPSSWSYGTGAFGTRVHSDGPGGDGLFSPNFTVVPGQKYRMIYYLYKTTGFGGIYMRLGESTSSDPTIKININDPSSSWTYGDFLPNVDIPTTPTLYAFDWVAPSNIHQVSMGIYNISTADLNAQYLACIPYAGVNQWGADVTENNTSNDTQFVGGVPSSTIASVVPTGYKLFINSGNRTYSIQAL